MSSRRTDYEKHGESKTRLYRVWQNIHKRCTCESDESFRKYGAKGITLCEEWKNSFKAFRDWAYASGYDKYAPSGECTIDRIDNSKGYYPQNCRWVNRYVQQNNRSVNHLLEIDGEVRTVSQWAKLYGKSYGQVYGRLRDGWSAADAVMKPIDERFTNGKNKNNENPSR